MTNYGNSEVYALVTNHEVSEVDALVTNHKTPVTDAMVIIILAAPNTTELSYGNSFDGLNIQQPCNYMRCLRPPSNGCAVS